MADERPAPLTHPGSSVRPRQRLARWIGAFVLLAATIWALASWALPAWLQSQMQRHGTEMLGRELRVERVEIAPLSLTMTLHGLSVAAAPGASASTPQLAIRRVHLDADARSLFRLAPVLQALQIDEPRLRVARLGDGRYDIDDVIKRLAARPRQADDKPARFALYNLQLQGGHLSFDDQPVQRQHEVRDLAVSLPFLSNLAEDIQVRVEPKLAFRFDGAAIDLKGQALPFAANRSSEIALKVAALDLSRFWAYLPASLPWKPQGGVLSTQMTVRFAQPAGATATVELAGGAQLTGLAVADRDGAPLLAWRTLDVALTSAQPLQRRVTLSSLRLDGAELTARRDASGKLNLAAPAPAPAEPLNPSTPSNPAQTRTSKAAASAISPAAGKAQGETNSWQFALDKLELVDCKVNWHDATVRPAADYRLQGVNVQASQVVWPLTQPVGASLSANWLAAGRPAGRLDATALASADAAQVKANLGGLSLAALQPYLDATLRPALEGQAAAQLQLDWADGDKPRMTLQAPTIRVDRLRLRERDARGGAAQPGADAAVDMASLQLKDIHVDVLRRRVQLASLLLSRPQVVVHRAADGTLSPQRWMAASPSDATAPATAPSKAASATWQIDASDIRIDDGRFTLHDDAVNPATATVPGERHTVHLKSLDARLQSLRWPAGPAGWPVRLSTQMTVGGGQIAAGRIELQGQATMAPLGWRGQLLVQRLSSTAFEPYVAGFLPLQLNHGELGWRGDIQLAMEPAGLRAQASGEAVVTELDLRSRPADTATGSTQDTQLLAWQVLQLKPLMLSVQPGGKPRIDIGELQLADFFAKLVITEQGRLNLNDLQPVTASGPAKPAAKTTEGAAELPVELVIGGTQLLRGRVDFNDRFIKPNYSAALSDLSGTVGRLASGTRDMAAVELRGRVAGTGLLDIRGSVNPTARPLALDIQARATDLELAPLSPYSGKYAGYAIERGKLSVDLAYKVDPDGRLEARNQIILNQLTFGEKVDSPDATKLPVRFALSLLADRQGVIDINLPVSGSINDPQFSVMGIVFKLIGNLIVKALTAPFSLLFGGGGGEEMSVLTFEPGSTRMAPGAAGVMDRVAKALNDKPALRMTVSGSADSGEADALRGERLRQALRDELRRESARAGASVAAVPELPAPASSEYAALLKRLYVQTPLPDKPRNLIGMARDLPVPEMEARLRAAMPVAADAWRELALQRSLAVRDALIARGLANDRLFVGAPKLRDAADSAWTPRVNLALSAP